MFRLCILAMLMLHKALLKVLRIFFDNFQSNFRGQEATSEPQTRDVEENAEIFQFQIAALYQLQVAWLNKCVCMYSYRHTHVLYVQMQKHVDTTIYTLIRTLVFIAFSFFLFIFSYESFSISCELTYGTTRICDTGISENISTALSFANKIHCNRM